jgi:hypothetical protein
VEAIFDLAVLRELVTRMASDLAGALGALLPRLLGALALLAVGWAVAHVAALASERLLRGLGLDRATRRLGLEDPLRHAALPAPASRLMARTIFWLLLLVFLLSAVETLGLQAVTGTLERLIAFLPALIAAAIVALVGLLLARLAGALTRSAATAAGLPAAARLGFLVEAGVAVMVGLIAAEQLGLDARLLVPPLTAAIVVLGLSAGVAFALGARPIVTHILAGHFLRQSLPRDGVLEVAGHRGVIERVGATDTWLRSDQRRIRIPNARLLEETMQG